LKSSKIKCSNKYENHSEWDCIILCCIFNNNLIIMTTFIPKIARKILSNPAMQRNYFLKPYGLDVTTELLRSLKTKTTPNHIHNTNFSSIRWFSTDLANRWTTMSWCSKYRKICPNQKLSNTCKNYTISISKRLTPSDIRELSNAIKWELPCSLNHIKRYMWWPVTKLTPFSMESFAIDSRPLHQIIFSSMYTECTA